MNEQISGNKTTVVILAMVLVVVSMCAFAFFVLGPGWFYPRDVSLKELNEHPTVYAGKQVKAVGYLVKHTAPHFGDTYVLCEGDPRYMYFAENPCIAVTGPLGTVDPYASFLYDGNNYEVALSPCSFSMPCRVAVSGVLRDRGPLTDASQHVIEASSIAWHE